MGKGTGHGHSDRQDRGAWDQEVGVRGGSCTAHQGLNSSVSRVSCEHEKFIFQKCHSGGDWEGMKLLGRDESEGRAQFREKYREHPNTAATTGDV